MTRLQRTRRSSQAPRRTSSGEAGTTAIRDALYRDILKALGGVLNPGVFEECAPDLLRKVYPSIAHVPGGSDDGIDALAADRGAERYFVVATTAEDVESNLRKNLRSHRRARHSGSPILATSRPIAATRRKKLEAIAAKEGYTLHMVYQRAWFAQELYRNAYWRKELLGLSGNPRALSVVPNGAREGLGGNLIGRDLELARLRDVAGDVVVVGQPGSGKTALLHALTAAGARFVVSGDLECIANEIREERPPILLVDDVGGTPFDRDFLSRLRQLRTTIGADFRIVAACWPSEEAQTADVLAAGSEQIITLGRLSKDKIVELVAATGLKGPTELVGLVVNQAEGLAGLARFLTEAILSGKTSEVYSGELIAARAYVTVDRLVGKEARYVLAVLSLAGDSGLPADIASNLVGMAPAAYAACLRGLAFGGVIRECRDHRRSIAVFPEMLRWIIVRDVFFSDPGFLSYERGLDAVPNEAEAMKALIGAHARGAHIPDLEQRIARLDRKDLWTRYAWVGPDEARYVVEHSQVALEHVAAPALRHVPDIVIPMLLAAAVRDRRPLHAHPDHPLRTIEKWIEALRPWRDDFLASRTALLDAVVGWDHSDETRADVVVRALSVAFSPNVHRAETDPGSGSTLTVSDGILRPVDLRRLRRLWPRALEVIRELPVTSWEPIFEMLRSWKYPLPLIKETKGSESARYAFVRQAVRDLAAVSRNRLGLQQRLAQEAAGIGFQLKGIVVDEDYELLFPTIDFDTGWRERFDDLARKFADRHEGTSPSTCAARLASLEREAALAPHVGPRLTPAACFIMAERSSEPLAWARALMAAGSAGDIVWPFLRKAVENRCEGADQVLSACLKEPSYALGAVTIILTWLAAPDDLVSGAIKRSSDYPQDVGMLCSGRGVPDNRVRFLLAHEHEAVRAAAVEGYWYRIRNGMPSEELTPAWTEAVLGVNRGHFLKEILQADLALAERWILTRLNGAEASQPHLEFGEEKIMQDVAPSLPLASRKRLVAAAREGRPALGDTMLAFVGDDEDSCREVFTRPELRRLRDDLLEGWPDWRWVGRAKTAIEAGYEPEDIARVSFYGVNYYSGLESEHWKSRRDAFNSLLNDQADPVLQRVLREGARLSAQRATSAAEKEQREAIFGDR